LTDVSNDLRTAVDKVLPGVRADLERLVRIPSVSIDPGHRNAVRESAEATAELFRDLNLPTVDILSVEGGAPAVVARRPAPGGRPTVLLYAHHDVQPTGDIAEWHTDPFVATERGGRLYGRGAADDKAGIMAHVAALRAYDGRPPVGVTVFVEGEEEAGSPTFRTFLETYHDRLAADVIVIADSANWEIGRPALTTSLRGLVDCTVEVRTLDHPVHSGLFGGPAPDALTALVRLLASLHDDAGNVAIPGLIGSDADPLDYHEARCREESGLLDGVHIIGTGSLTSRLWRRPAATVLAIDAPRVGDAANVLQATARAKVSVRIAPDQDAEAALRALVAHLRANTPWGAQVTITEGTPGQPVSLTASGSAYDAARAAFEEAWGVPPVDVGIGGSIPFIAEFRELYPDAAILVTGIEDPDSRAHGFNESLHLGEFAKACLAEALLLQKIGDQSGPQPRVS
jgi:cysteinylglycine-S-conjugate dipeptidase